MKLVPPGSSLYKQVTNWAHKKYHYFGPNYIKAQLQLQGYWVPQAVKRLKMLQDNCAHCKRHKKQVVLNTEMGSVPCSRLTSSFPFKEITSDICGPFVCRGFVDSRKTRKVYILVNICHYTRYISLSLLESMNSEVLLQTIKMHSLRYGKIMLELSKTWKWKALTKRKYKRFNWSYRAQGLNWYRSPPRLLGYKAVQNMQLNSQKRSF